MEFFNGATKLVTFYGRPKTPAPGPDFTLMTLPDTQLYSENLNNRFSQFLSQTNWIVSSKNTLNTAFVADQAMEPPPPCSPTASLGAAHRATTMAAAASGTSTSAAPAGPVALTFRATPAAAT